MVYQKHGFFNNLNITNYLPPIIILVSFFLFINVPIAQEMSTEQQKHITDIFIGVKKRKNAIVSNRLFVGETDI